MLFLRPTLALLLLAFTANGQVTLQGKVVNEKNREPLAFVSIVIKGYNGGTTTDIDGRFKLTLPAGYHELVITHIGFEPRALTVHETNTSLIIRLREKATELTEIVVHPEDNPALRIIRQATKNKPINDPDNRSSFSYNSYNKLYSTLLSADSTATLSNGLDTARLRRYLQNNHLFIHESYTERQYIRPNLNKETVLGNHLSGIKDPFFAFLATDLQPFSFYKDFIKLFSMDYLSPLSPGSTNKYDFILSDTLYHGTDSTYVIHFEPLPGHTFNGLKGQLYITTDGYALESVQAEPADKQAMIESLIQQRYEKIDGHWFPAQLNSELRFRNFEIRGLKLRYVSRSYLTNIHIDQPIDTKQFTSVNVEFAPQANRRTDAFWDTTRTGEFSQKEQNTFHNLDSVGKKMVGFQTAFKVLEGLFVGRFKAGAFFLPLEYLVQLNQYESIRLGLGFQTGNSLSKIFSLEGYAGWGFKDEALKYGGGLRINVSTAKDAYFRFSYRQDLLEPGRPVFIKSPIAASSQESLRNWMSSRMDSLEQYRFEFSERPFHGSKITVFAQQQLRNPTYRYTFISPEDNTHRTSFKTFEAGVQWRFAPKESTMKIGESQVVTRMTYPQLNVAITKGFAGALDGEYDFTKIELRIDHQLMVRSLGKLTLQLAAGAMDAQVPLPYLFNGKGSKFSDSFLNNVAAGNYFQTMGLYEFVINRYAYLFLNHYVGRLTGNKSKYFRPELSLVHNTGIGNLTGTELHQGVDFKTLEKGFLESGLIITNLVRFNYLDLAYLGLGAGAFYRYGPYALPDTADNLVVKLMVNFSF
jgi:hypothetical protein